MFMKLLLKYSSVNEQNHQLTHTVTVLSPETWILPIPRSKTLSWSLSQHVRKCEKQCIHWLTSQSDIWIVRQHCSQPFCIIVVCTKSLQVLCCRSAGPFGSLVSIKNILDYYSNFLHSVENYPNNMPHCANLYIDCNKFPQKIALIQIKIHSVQNHTM